MKLFFAGAVTVTAGIAFTVGTATGSHVHPERIGARGVSTQALNSIVKRYCATCHSATSRQGNLSLAKFDVDSAADNTDVAERVIRTLRSQMMPPPGARTPRGDSLVSLVETLEQTIDKAAKPNPGNRTFQRLNRAEYDNAIRDLFGLEFSSADYLPLDTKSANFDNIADVQSLSPTLLESYLNAAAAVSTMAVGDRKAANTMVTYGSSPFTSQHPWDHVEGTPYGTRGGIVAMHTFPADGMYSFRLNVSGGTGMPLQDIDISINGTRIALLHYERGIDRNLASADAPNGADYVRSDPIFVRAGQQRLTASFIVHNDGTYEDLIKPHEWSRASNGTASAGTTEPPHLLEIAVLGPDKITGVSDNPTRKLIFTCHPTAAKQQRACAEEILTRLGTRAYRRPLTAHDRAALMTFYDSTASKQGFEDGVRTALEAILASPYFVFRFETAPAKVAPGSDFQISDYELASRLSFFLWGSLPDQQLLTLASQHKLSDKKVLDREVHRMLADPKSEALSTRFAAQWLRLQDLDKVHPDAFLFPDFDLQLADAMRTETELFFNDIVQNDRPITDVFDANYTYVNERLAHHYGIPNVSGPEFRKVTYPDSSRRGILGQGSMLVQTSVADRTSPVLRGKWVMEVLLGSPPPPPPPGVPALEETKGSKDGHQLTTRERMEIHRANPTCNACHQFMDPMGLALDNFDVTGKYRYRENAVPLDTKGKLYDGTPVSSSADLIAALLRRPIPLMRNFTENLMAYAIGRRMEDFDQPTIRAIAKDAESKGYRLSSFVVGVVNSPAFRSKRAEPVSTLDNSR
ncbi:MAG: DUF1592 domain-containing protein [Gemmatimonadaceae bacterium]